MRVAIVSDIHGNRHAFEAVLDAIEASSCRGDVVPWRPRRLRGRAGRVRRAGAAVCRDLPGRQPRSRRPRGASARAVLARRGAGGALDPGDDIGPRPASTWTSSSRQNLEEAVGLLPRQPPGPDLGVRAVAVAGRAVPRRPAPPRLPRSAIRTSRCRSRGAAVQSATGQTRAADEELDLPTANG